MRVFFVGPGTLKPLPEPRVAGLRRRRDKWHGWEAAYAEDRRRGRHVTALPDVRLNGRPGFWEGR